MKRTLVRLGALLMVLSSLSGQGVGAAASGPPLPPPEQLFAGDALALLDAALQGDASRARRLVTAGTDPNSRAVRSEGEGRPRLTLLNYATARRKESAMATLIDVGADPLLETYNDGDAFIFAVARVDAAILDVLYKLWPLAKIPAARQTRDAFGALGFHCNPCLEVMFHHGLPPAVTNGIGTTLLMSALNSENLEMAEALISRYQVPLTATTSRGLTAPYALQTLLERYPTDAEPRPALLRLKRLMEEKGIVFPVESPAEFVKRMRLS